MKIIPGHAKAFTIWITLILAVATFALTRDLKQTMGIVILILGIFLGDQATHLAQEDHSAPPSTYIEQAMQSHRWIFILLGLVVSIFGLHLIY